MPKKETPLTVVLEPVFVRDHQRRLRLVIDLLEQEAHRQYIPPTNSQSQPKLGVPAKSRRITPEATDENRCSLRSRFQH